MSMMTYEQARAESARVLAEHDAEYGSPAEWAARECSERAFQERKAERARKQQETDRRVAKHQQMLAVRKAERSQPQTLAEFNAANPGWVSWWTNRLETAFDKSARSYNEFVARLDTLSKEEVSAQEKEVQTTPFGALFVLLAQCVAGVHKEIREEQIEPLQRKMEQRAAVGDAERALLQAALEAKQRQLDELKAKLAQQSEQFERRIAVLEARLSEQQRIADIEARLAARQDAKNAAAAATASAPSSGAANVRGTAVQTPVWVEQWWEPQHRVLIDAIGEMLATERRASHEAVIKLTERVVRLEAASDFEERFNRLASEIKRGSEIPQSELLAKIEALQRELDALKQATGQPGPPGPPGKLPLAREYVPERVHYEADVVTHAGALWQARGDTVHWPPHTDWSCLARAGRDGLTPTICGTYDACGKYKKLDIVAWDGASFVAKHDNPGICPGDGWQLLSRQGRPGRRGETGERGARGEKGERGAPGGTVVSWQLDRARYRISPLMSDGTVGPMMELRGLFEQYLSETS